MPDLTEADSDRCQDDMIASPAGDDQAEQHFELNLTPSVARTGERLDRYLAAELPDYSRSFLQALIDDGRVTIDGRPVRRNQKVTAGQEIHVTVPPVQAGNLAPEAIPLSVLYEDDDVLVIDKPAGLVVHPAPGHGSGTLVNAVLHHAPDIAIAGSDRPGIVHRLDKDTSGVMVIAKSDRGHTTLLAQWQERTVSKRYLALVAGEIEETEGTVDAPIDRDRRNRLRMAVQAGGRSAVTHFRVVRRFSGATLLEVDLETGRTHQIRVHLAFIGHPIVGDPIYNRLGGQFGGGGEALTSRQFLHATELGLTLTDGERRVFSAPLPSDLAEALMVLGVES